jgi:hypothetical protein
MFCLGWQVTRTTQAQTASNHEATRADFDRLTF